MAFLGEEYDVLTSKGDFRLMFVGYDYGTGHSGLIDRRNSIQAFAGSLNPHYRGIVKTLMEIYQHSCGNEATGIWRPLLKRMAQTNATRCCAPDGERMKCNTTNQMRRDCWIHFKKEIEILQPTMMIFHGAALPSPFLECLKQDHIPFHRRLPIVSPSAVDAAFAELLYTIDFGDFTSTVLFLHHPAYGCLGRQWQSVVIPALDHLRSAGIIPNVNDEWTPRAMEGWPSISN